MIDRESIHIISRHSTWSESSIEKTLKERVYQDRTSWQQFLRLFFISLGIGFTTAGIIFFFAYNWNDLHKFVKIGLIESVVVLLTLLVLFSNINITIKNILLTGTAILVGVLFAVFGQIYQTGANAYDFFLGWSVFITLWVLMSNFAPLWLVYIVLLNITLILYSEQVASDWSAVFVFTLVFILNTSLLLGSIMLGKSNGTTKAPVWFSNTIALAAVSIATIGMITGIWDKQDVNFLVLIIITALSYLAGIWYGLKEKRAFYLSIIPFSLIIIFSAFLIKISSSEGMLLFTSLFIILSITLAIKNIIGIQKKWTNE